MWQSVALSPLAQRALNFSISFLGFWALSLFRLGRKFRRHLFAPLINQLLLAARISIEIEIVFAVARNAIALAMFRILP